MVDRDTVVAEKTTRWTHCLFKRKIDAVGRWIGICFFTACFCRSYSNPKKAREKRSASLFAGICLPPSIYSYLIVCISAWDQNSPYFSIKPELHLASWHFDRASHCHWNIIAPVTCLSGRKDAGGCSRIYYCVDRWQTPCGISALSVQPWSWFWKRSWAYWKRENLSCLPGVLANYHSCSSVCVYCSWYQSWLTLDVVKLVCIRDG